MRVLHQFMFAIFIALFGTAILFSYDLFFIQDHIYAASKDGITEPISRMKDEAIAMLDDWLGESPVDASLARLPMSVPDVQMVLNALAHDGLLLESSAGHQFAVASEMAIDYRQMLTLPIANQPYEMLFAAPFAVPNELGEIFWFVGLFQFSHQVGQIQQLDSVYVGNQVAVEQIHLVELPNQRPRLQISYQAPLATPETLTNNQVNLKGEPATKLHCMQFELLEHRQAFSRS